MTTLHNAQIILPDFDNNNQPLTNLHKWLRGVLCREFGGCTSIQAFGSWVDDSGKLFDETVTIYNIAMEDCPVNVERLHQIARLAGQEAKQLAMYVQNPDGTVHILNTKD